MLWQAGVLSDKLLEQPVVGQWGGPASDMARLACNEVARLSRQGRVTLVLDGLEKVPERALATDLFDALALLPESTEIVTVVPWSVAFGPQAGQALVRQGERFVAVRAPEVAAKPGEAGRAFLRHMLARRLGLPAGAFDRPSPGPITTHLVASVPPDMAEVVERAAELSGGVPRTFLQMVADAGTYAKLRGSAWPVAADLVDAVSDQQDSLRRILLPGDRAILKEFDGEDGAEMDPEVKVRMLAHALLLEREVGGAVVLRMHPLLAPIVRGGSDA